MLHVAVALAILASAASVVDAATASWDPNSEPDLAGYMLSYGTQSGVHTTTIDVGKVTTYQFNPAPGKRYYVVVQAYNTAGQLSAKSAEAIIDIPLSNSPPILAQPANQSSTLNSSTSLAMSASDPNGTALTFAAAGLPPGLSINSVSGLIAGIPSAKGTYPIAVVVSDGALMVARTFMWTVVEPVNAPGALPLDIAFDLGPNGLWMNYAATGWKKLHATNPEEMASGDVDGNGQSDLIVDLPGLGVSVWLNDSTWIPLTSLNSGPIITADLDGTGKSAVLVEFPGSGVWVWRFGGSWSYLDLRKPLAMAVGDLDGNGRADVVINFAQAGVRVWMNNQSWLQLHDLNATSMAVGDLDGNGRKDVLLAFPGTAGTWVWRNNTSWLKVHAQGASLMTTGDLDQNGQDEAIMSIPGSGLWVWLNGAVWSQLDARNPEGLTATNLDGNGRTDLVVDFGAAGLWVWWNNSNWTQMNVSNPEGSVAGKFKQRD